MTHQDRDGHSIRNPATDGAARAPLLNVPAIVAVLIVVLVACHLALEAFPRSWQLWVIHAGSVSPRLILAGPQGDGGLFQSLAPLVTHMFIHADWSHVLLNSVWLLAFGAPTALRLGAQRRLFDAPSMIFLLFFLISGVAGALAFIAANQSVQTQMIGASGGVSGLLGALIRSAFHNPAASANVRRSFAKLADSRVLIASFVILATNLVVGLFSGVFAPGEADIAWESHMGGFVFGLLTFPAFAALVRRR